MYSIGIFRMLEVFSSVWLLRVLGYSWFCVILCMYPVLVTWKKSFMCILDHLKLYLMGFGAGLFLFITSITPFHSGNLILFYYSVNLFSPVCQISLSISKNLFLLCFSSEESTGLLSVCLPGGSAI